jgi:hypothetical protein
MSSPNWGSEMPNGVAFRQARYSKTRLLAVPPANRPTTMPTMTTIQRNRDSSVSR